MPQHARRLAPLVAALAVTGTVAASVIVGRSASAGPVPDRAQLAVDDSGCYFAYRKGVSTTPDPTTRVDVTITDPYGNEVYQRDNDLAQTRALMAGSSFFTIYPTVLEVQMVAEDVATGEVLNSQTFTVPIDDCDVEGHARATITKAVVGTSPAEAPIVQVRPNYLAWNPSNPCNESTAGARYPIPPGTSITVIGTRNDDGEQWCIREIDTRGAASVSTTITGPAQRTNGTITGTFWGLADQPAAVTITNTYETAVIEPPASTTTTVPPTTSTVPPTTSTTVAPPVTLQPPISLVTTSTTAAPVTTSTTAAPVTSAPSTPTTAAPVATTAPAPTTTAPAPTTTAAAPATTAAAPASTAATPAATAPAAVVLGGTATAQAPSAQAPSASVPASQPEGATLPRTGGGSVPTAFLGLLLVAIGVVTLGLRKVLTPER